MKKLFLLLAAFVLPHFSWAQIVLFQANMTGAQEVPATASPATGFASASLDTVTDILTFNETFSGLVAGSTASHIHKAPIGVSGPIVIPFAGFPTGVTSGTYANTFTLTAPQAADLLAGLYYVNIHSTSFPGGEIRGQLLAVPSGVPEPSTYALVGAALLGWLSVRRRIRGRHAAI